MKFDGGAVRDTFPERWDLIPVAAMEAMAKALHEGANRYGAHNYRKGMPTYVILNHAIRHIYKFIDGDRTEDHLGHALTGVAMAIDVEDAADKASERESLEAVAKLAGMTYDELVGPRKGVTANDQ